ncbi:MAG: hypothetical protein H6555_02670 [Lewinellaceae bacterium]|nr:hypothetical protein [Lewinellaceae bacterium]
MITLYVQEDHIQTVQTIIDGEFRLGELVRIVDLLSARPIANAYSLLVKKDRLQEVLDWHNSQPPYLLPEEIPLEPENLLGLIYARLGNYERAYQLLAAANPNLWLDLDISHRLQLGVPIQPEELPSEYTTFEEYRLMHNQAIVRFYGSAGELNLQQIEYFFREALGAAPHQEYQAFTAAQFAGFLADTGYLDHAEEVLVATLDDTLSADAQLALKKGLSSIGIQQLTVPHDPILMDRTKTYLWEVVQALEKQERWAELGLALIDASHIANICDSFSESLGYINRAIDLFQREESPELLAQAHLRRGTLMYTWAQNGQPQFYPGALESYQQALQVFTREDAPALFAEIHHHLGVIYSEIPDEAKKKSIWAAVSSSSFQEALQYFTQENDPYNYALICNSFGNALTKYPAAVHSDNIAKALFYYQEALNIRTAHQYPLERTLTLLNYLEAAWNLSLPEDDFHLDHYTGMVEKAREVLELTDDPLFQQRAQQHLDKLDALKAIYQNA